MELRDAKKLIAYAKKNGIKSLKVGDVEVTFSDDVVTKYASAKVSTELETPISTQVKDVTLDDINDYIYGEEVTNA